MFKIITKMLSAVLIFIILATGITGVFIYSFFSSIYFPSDETAQESITAREELPDSRINILLLGVDADKVTGARSDTIIIVSLDTERKRASMLSIPRDSYVNIEGHGKDKINHAHAFGGPGLATGTIENLLEIQIHHYARINLMGFEKMIDLLGGVEINVEPEIARVIDGMNSGSQKLSGEQALAYVRVRKVGDDFGRIQRQQKFLAAVAKQSLAFTNITKVPGFMSLLGDNLETDIPPLKMTLLIRDFLKTDVDSVQQGYIPGRGTYIDGTYYYIVDEEATGMLVHELKIK